MVRKAKDTVKKPTVEVPKKTTSNIKVIANTAIAWKNKVVNEGETFSVSEKEYSRVKHLVKKA